MIQTLIGDFGNEQEGTGISQEILTSNDKPLAPRKPTDVTILDQPIEPKSKVSQVVRRLSTFKELYDYAVSKVVLLPVGSEFTTAALFSDASVACDKRSFGKVICELRRKEFIVFSRFTTEDQESRHYGYAGLWRRI